MRSPTIRCPRCSSQHSSCGTLLEAGVRIHRYPVPAVLQAKHVTVDDLARLTSALR